MSQTQRKQKRHARQEQIKENIDFSMNLLRKSIPERRIKKKILKTAGVGGATWLTPEGTNEIGIKEFIRLVVPAIAYPILTTGTLFADSKHKTIVDDDGTILPGTKKFKLRLNDVITAAKYTGMPIYFHENGFKPKSSKKKIVKPVESAPSSSVSSSQAVEEKKDVSASSVSDTLSFEEVEAASDLLDLDTEVPALIAPRAAPKKTRSSATVGV